MPLDEYNMPLDEYDMPHKTKTDYKIILSFSYSKIRDLDDDALKHYVNQIMNSNLMLNNDPIKSHCNEYVLNEVIHKVKYLQKHL